jgi:hypothetical protein
VLIKSRLNIEDDHAAANLKWRISRLICLLRLRSSYMTLQHEMTQTPQSAGIAALRSQSIAVDRFSEISNEYLLRGTLFVSDPELWSGG